MKNSDKYIDLSMIAKHCVVTFLIMAASIIRVDANGPAKEIREMKGSWFTSGIYSINIANNCHTYSKIGAMGGYLGNWGGYVKVAFDLVGNRTPNIVGGFTKRLATFYSKNSVGSALYMYFGAGCGNVEHAGVHTVPGEVITLPDGSIQYIPSEVPPKTYWDAGTSVMFDTGLIYRYKRLNFALGYSIIPDIGFIYGESDAPNHSIQIGIGYTF